MKNLREKFRLPEKSTPEELEMRGFTVLAFGRKTIVAGYYYNPSGNEWFGASYEFTTEDRTIEGEVRLKAISENMFEDNGHAMAWAMNN